MVADTIDGQPVVVFAGPGEDGFAMAAYVPSAGDVALTFAREHGTFVDRQTGSRWTIEGRAVEGTLIGTVLEPVPWYYVRWHAWFYSHRDTRLFLSGREPVPFEEIAGPLGPFAELLAALAGAGHEIRVAEPLVSQRRPREALASLRVHVDGDRLNLHAFGSEGAARDLHAFDASWSGYPLRARTHEGRTRRIGTVVIESDPPERYADPANVVPLPDAMIRWSKVLTAPALDALSESTVRSDAEGESPPGFVDVVRAIRLSGFEVIDVGFLPPSQLRVGAVNGIGAHDRRRTVPPVPVRFGRPGRCVRCAGAARVREWTLRAAVDAGDDVPVPAGRGRVCGRPLDPVVGAVGRRTVAQGSGRGDPRALRARGAAVGAHETLRQRRRSNDREGGGVAMRSEIEKEIRTFIVEEVLDENEEVDLPEDIPLLSGLLDSFGLMSLIGFLEDRYKVIIRNDQVVKNNFESVSALAAFLEAKIDEGAPDRAAAQGS